VLENEHNDVSELK